MNELAVSLENGFGMSLVEEFICNPMKQGMALIAQGYEVVHGIIAPRFRNTYSLLVDVVDRQHILAPALDALQSVPLDGGYIIGRAVDAGEAVNTVATAGTKLGVEGWALSSLTASLAGKHLFTFRTKDSPASIWMKLLSALTAGDCIEFKVSHAQHNNMSRIIMSTGRTYK